MSLHRAQCHADTRATQDSLSIRDGVGDTRATHGSLPIRDGVGDRLSEEGKLRLLGRLNGLTLGGPLSQPLPLPSNELVLFMLLSSKSFDVSAQSCAVQGRAWLSHLLQTTLE